MAPILRSQFTDLFLEDQLPALESLVYSRYDRFPEQYSRIFNVKTTKRDIVQTTEVAGLGLMTTIVEGGPVNYDSPIQAFDKTYKPVQYGLGFKVSRVAFDDDRFDLIRKTASELGRSAKETVEVQAATVLNNAFATTGPDGKVLCATDHPLVGGGTQANRPTNHTDLDVPSLEDALTTMRTWKDHRGRKIRIAPRLLVVAPANGWNAAEILKGVWRGDTANHTINAFREQEGMPSFNDFMVYDYLTDTDAWFVISDKEDHSLDFYWREKPNVVHDVDFDSRSLKTAMWMRFDVGFSSYLGIYGTQGA